MPKGSYAELLTVRALDHTSGAREGKGHEPSKLEDVKRVASFCIPPVGDMLQIQWWTGMRSGELRIMRSCDIIMEGPIWIYQPSKHKNDWRGKGHERYVLFPPDAIELLKPHLKPGDPTDYIFKPTQGKSDLFSRAYYTQAIAKACQKAGVKITAYGGRHAARDRIAQKYGPEIARIFLGHKNLDTTQLYGTRDIQAAIRVLRDDIQE